MCGLKGTNITAMMRTVSYHSNNANCELSRPFNGKRDILLARKLRLVVILVLGFVVLHHLCKFSFSHTYVLSAFISRSLCLKDTAFVQCKIHIKRSRKMPFLKKIHIRTNISSLYLTYKSEFFNHTI